MTATLEGGEWSAARSGRTLPPGKDSVPIVQEARWAPGPVWTGGKSRPHRDSMPDRPARSQSLYRLTYPVHNKGSKKGQITLNCDVKSATIQKAPRVVLRSVGLYQVTIKVRVASGWISGIADCVYGCGGRANDTQELRQPFFMPWPRVGEKLLVMHPSSPLTFWRRIIFSNFSTPCI